jgi:hypothetical protein
MSQQLKSFLTPLQQQILDLDELLALVFRLYRSSSKRSLAGFQCRQANPALDISIGFLSTPQKS